MFTGIIETIGKVIELNQDDGNLHIIVESPFQTVENSKCFPY